MRRSNGKNTKTPSCRVVRSILIRACARSQSKSNWPIAISAILPCQKCEKPTSPRNDKLTARFLHACPCNPLKRNSFPSSPSWVRWKYALVRYFANCFPSPTFTARRAIPPEHQFGSVPGPQEDAFEQDPKCCDLIAGLQLGIGMRLCDTLLLHLSGRRVFPMDTRGHGLKKGYPENPSASPHRGHPDRDRRNAGAYKAAR